MSDQLSSKAKFHTKVWNLVLTLHVHVLHILPFLALSIVDTEINVHFI